MSPPTSGRKGPTRAAKKAANSSYYTSAVSENEPTIDIVTASPPSTDTGDTGDTADVSVIVKRKMVELAEDELPKKKKKSSGAKKPGKTTTTINSTPYYKSQQADKPDPLGSPDIWATTRQALCETVFPWYNSHQAGAYRKDGLVHGLMCDQETDVRDRLDHQILITRVGGGRSKDADGNKVQEKDQDKAGIAQDFINTMSIHHPVGLIIGQGNTNCPSKLPHYYNVFAWYHVTDVWSEKRQGKTRWMVRMEKIKLNEVSWWMPVGSTSPPAQPDDIAISASCPKCKQSSKHIYNAGWCCLNNECKKFFDFGKGYNDDDLGYNPAFITERTTYAGKAPGPMARPLLTQEDMDSKGLVGYEAEFRKGIVCSKCGCCSRRLRWDRWDCENPDCDFVYALGRDHISITDVIAHTIDDPSYRIPKTFVRHGVKKEFSMIGLYKVYTYLLPDLNGEIIGFVKHFKSCGAINQEPNGPNDLFDALQKDAINMKRGVARGSGSVGEKRTAHFARNFGAPYKYGVKQDSTRFDEAPPAVLMFVKRMTWAGKISVSDSQNFHDFNECLAIGYCDGSKIGFHDDGEKELGDTVVSGSLGCVSRMEWRLKYMVMVEGKLKRQSSSLGITLEHGDLMVMHGAQIQKLYEHKVDPYGILRYALTCRYIRPETLPTDQDRLYSISAGTIPESFTYDYNGELEPSQRLDKRNANEVEVDQYLARLQAMVACGAAGKEDTTEKLKGLVQAFE